MDYVPLPKHPPGLSKCQCMVSGQVGSHRGQIRDENKEVRRVSSGRRPEAEKYMVSTKTYRNFP